MTDQWVFKSETYDNCNCAMNCGCQFNLPSTNGHCRSAFVGTVVEGRFNDTPLSIRSGRSEECAAMVWEPVEHGASDIRAPTIP